MTDMNSIHLDCGQYIAVLYNDSYGECPTGMIGPGDIADISAKATEWVSSGLEFGSPHRAEIVYMTGDIPIKVEVDLTIAARVRPE